MVDILDNKGGLESVGQSECGMTDIRGLLRLEENVSVCHTLYTAPKNLLWSVLLDGSHAVNCVYKRYFGISS